VAQPVTSCQQRISLEIDLIGSVALTSGHACGSCRFSPA
jgi:hypothetical protein